MLLILVLTFVSQSIGYLTDPDNPIEVTFFIMSDTNNKVLATHARPERNAVQAWDEYYEWTASIPGATWIWSDVDVLTPYEDETVTFTNTFYVPGGVIEGSLELAADHSVWVYLNNQETKCQNELGSFSIFSQFTCDLSFYLTPGQNTLKLIVTNHAKTSEDDEPNPAGLLYKMMIKSLV